jgi:hypothetical protein
MVGSQDLSPGHRHNARLIQYLDQDGVVLCPFLSYSLKGAQVDRPPPVDSMPPERRIEPGLARKHLPSFNVVLSKSQFRIQEA